MAATRRSSSGAPPQTLGYSLALLHAIRKFSLKNRSVKHATITQLENPNLEVGYAEATVGADEVAIAASPSGKAHAIVNVDPQRTTFFLGCQDSSMNYNDSSTDFNVWKGL